MPYLKPDDKAKLLEHLGDVFPETAGQLNFLITMLAKRYWNKSARNYEALNAVVGAIESSKIEFYRRQCVPYENEKIKLNGDVYEGDFE